MADRPVGFGRREDAAPASGAVATATAPGAIELDDAAASRLLPERQKRGHKGSFGKLLVIAGSLDYAGAALLVASFLAAQLIALAHQSGAEHSVCPEHGELIHGRTLAAAWSGPVAEARKAPQPPRDDHDVCEPTLASHDRFQPPEAAPAVEDPPAAVRQAPAPRERAAGDSLALYRLAPKTSPPA